MNAAEQTGEHWSEVVAAASEPYRNAGAFAWRYARGKLGIDPVFRHLLSQGLIAPQARVLDIGCGQGLLASLVTTCTRMAQQGRWPRGWAAAPAAARVTGIELMPRDIERARTSLGNAAEFVCGDMRNTPFPQADVVVILDVLHYISIPEQNEVLTRVRRALQPRGTLLLRIGDASDKGRFWTSQWVDALVIWVRGHRSLPQYTRTLAEWVAQLESLGFEVRSQPMSKGTPFANVLLVGRLRAEA